MSKKYKSQASSARAANSTFGSSTFGSPSAGFQTSSSSLSYITELPDLGGISDPNVVVSLRNLGKKDSITKAKALEELQEHVRSTPTIEASVLDAWVDLYPRTSIDNSRRVRQLAHSLQGSFTILSGKRIAPLLPKVIGPWLCGLFDNDKSVARATQDAISAAFPTEDKRKALWRVYKDSLLDYAEDAILMQTPKTLSDERSTTPDDAESKYARVVGTGMTSLGYLVKVNSEGSAKASEFRDKATKLVNSKKLWEFAYNKDPYLRRGVYALAISCVGIFETELDWTTISTSFLGKGLHASQLGSSVQFSEALLTLTKVRPEIWTSHYTSKSSTAKRLLQFLRPGSQRGTERFWTNVEALLKIIPPVAWQGDGSHVEEDVANLIEALQNGITNADEPRQNLPAAWACYVDTCSCLSKQISDASAREAFFRNFLAPLAVQYVSHDPARSSWTLPTAQGLSIAANALDQMQRHPKILDDLWSDVSQQLIEKMKLSLPESSKDFAASQDAVIAMSSRLCNLKVRVVTFFGGTSTLPETRLSLSDQLILEAAIEILKNRNGKPYGAAAVLKDLCAQPSFDKNEPRLVYFVDNDLPGLLQSPSAERLVDIARVTGRPIDGILQRLLQAPQLNSHGERALDRLLSNGTEAELSIPAVQKASLEATTNLSTSSKSRVLISSILRNSLLNSTDVVDHVIEHISNNLSSTASAVDQDSTLQLLVGVLDDPTSRSALTTGESGTIIMSRLLLLSESPDHAKADIASKVLTKMKTPHAGESAPNTTLSIIANQLSGRDAPISVLSLVDLAKDAFEAANDKTQVFNTIIPSAQDWQNALRPHFGGSRPYSLSITSSLQGTVYIIESSTSVFNTVRDSDDFSVAFRLVLYLTKILVSQDIIHYLDATMTNDIFHYYPVALQLVNEKLTMESANDIWINSTAEVLEEAVDVLSQGSHLIQMWLDSQPSFAVDWLAQLDQLHGSGSHQYYYGLTFSDITSRIIDINGPSQVLNKIEAELKGLHRSNDVLRSSCIASSLRDYFTASEQGRRLINELIADTTDLKSLEFSLATLRPLVLLNILLAGDLETLEGIPSQRLVFLMQKLVRLLASASVGDIILPEVLKLLCSVLPTVQGIYGPHWEQILQGLIRIWNHGNDLEDGLPVLHSSLRLCQRLRGMSMGEDPNEDLVDAWTASQLAIEDGLLQCLQYFDQPATGINQPRQITAEILSRLLSNVKPKDVAALYPLLLSPEQAVLSVSYQLLHRAIPARQEQLSLDLALEKKATHLPPELISLVDGETSMKRYLLSWNLIFDHFNSASYKLRELYSTDVKDTNQLPILLSHICDTIRITQGRPLDASKLDISDFELGQTDSDEKELQWLCVHLYYNCLLHLPSLTKTWFIEQKNRVKSPLETWTQKYISPSIVSASVGTVTEWAGSQDEDDAPVTVKSSPKGSEIVASIGIDPESPPIAIAITLPGSYPLESPTVTARTRVGVSEKNWQSWLRTFQIIIFSTGSIIEGLIAFRRNVQGALKGQSECAICYSIIGTDMQTPNKKCGTCKNTFHGSCLFRWFKSSNSSSCPLCRNNFNYA